MDHKFNSEFFPQIIEKQIFFTSKLKSEFHVEKNMIQILFGKSWILWDKF